MSQLRQLFVIFGLLCVLNCHASEAPYPEVFDEFITGWVEYDDGYYAAALRAFARAHALDPEFRPATEAMAASLGHMGMPEIGEAIVRDRWVSKGSEYTYRQAIAFWGVFHSAGIDAVSTAGLEQAVTGALDKLVDTPVVLTSPSTSTWAERKNQQPCEYNLLIFIFQEPDTAYAVARIHLIRNYDVASGKELDLALSIIPTGFTHQSVEINLHPEDIALLSDNEDFHEGLRELLDPRVEIENPPYRIDAETEAPLDETSKENPWMYVSKASVSTEFALDHYRSIKDFYRSRTASSTTTAALGPGYPAWLAHQLEIEHPMRPWLLAEANHANMSGKRWYTERAKKLQDELARDHPDHPALLAIELFRDTWGMHHLNYEERMPRTLTVLEKLRRLPADVFEDQRHIENLERFEKTIRACLGEPIREPFIPLLISRPYQELSRDGTFRLRFNGSPPTLHKDEVHAINDHEQFAMEVLIQRMSMITDAKVLFATYKEHVQRDDELGGYLKRARNAVLWRIKVTAEKETYDAACKWWVQKGVDLLESGASWGEIGRTLPSSYLAYEEFNQPLVEPMNRKLEQDGLEKKDENAWFAFTAARRWRIPFLDFSPKSREILIQYYRERAADDLDDYFNFLSWLHWSNAKELFRAEALYAQGAYINRLNAESDPGNRVKLAQQYGQLLVAADLTDIAYNVCAYVSPDIEKIKADDQGKDLHITYALDTVMAKALIGEGRLSEADQLIDQVLYEIDGQYIRYIEYYIFNFTEYSHNNSLSSTLLELKNKIQQTR